MDIFILAFDRVDVTANKVFIKMMFNGIYEAYRMRFINKAASTVPHQP